MQIITHICNEDSNMSEDFFSIQKIDDLFIDNYNQNANRKQNSKKNVLEMGIEELHTVGDLIDKTEDEIIKVKYLEQRSLEDIQYQLAKLGLTLRSSDG